VTRWTVATLAVLILAGAVAVALGRAVGWSGARASLMTAVASQWLGAWVVWGLAGHLAVRYGLAAVYEPALFAAIGIPAAIWQYRAAVTTGAERARMIFVGAQLAWLVVVLGQNGLFR
jgi:hypothetical protein